MYQYRNNRAVINPSSPRALAVCDRCGMLYNHKDLNWQTEWRGPQLKNLMILICESCLDDPQEQLRTMIIPADPVPIPIPRQEAYISEISTLPPATVPGPFSTIPAYSNPAALAALLNPVPPNSEDQTPYNATSTPPSSYFSVVQDL